MDGTAVGAAAEAGGGPPADGPALQRGASRERLNGVVNQRPEDKPPHSGLDALTSRSTLLEPPLPGLLGGGRGALRPATGPGSRGTRSDPDPACSRRSAASTASEPESIQSMFFANENHPAHICSSGGLGGWGGLQTDPDSQAPPEPGDRRRAEPRPWNHQGRAAPAIHRPSAGRCHGDLSQRPVTVIQEPV